MKHYHQAAIALALFVGAGVANAQTTVIERAPAQTVVTTEQPLALTPVQRQTIYRTIVQEPTVVEAPPPTVEYRVGMHVPATAHLYAVPPTVVTEVPAVSSYRYMVVNHRVVLVDPATSEVVAELGD